MRKKPLQKGNMELDEDEKKLASQVYRQLTPTVAMIW
jgi:hypothetical protein